MKKIISLALCVVIALSLLACGSESSPGPEVVEKKNFSSYAGIVEDPRTWYDTLMAMPIANENMTEQELRQLCVDAFKMNMTFPWTPNTQISYTYELLDRYSEVLLSPGIAYSGLFYATGIEDATCGNVWKVLPYYDLETGVVDIEAMGKNVLNNFSSACSFGAIQGWNRVSNGHNLKAMGSYNQYDANIVPVGPYTYEPFHYNYNFGSRTASNEIIAANGDAVILESYAQTKMADGVYSSSSWHVMMICQDPVVVRNADGTINPEESYVLVHEQGTGGTLSDKHNYAQGNGVAMRPLGTIDNKFTFQKLLEKGYIPFTLKEFTGEDPVEPGESWLGTPTTKLETGADIDANGLFCQILYANYNICTILVEVKAPDGTVLVSYYPQAITKPYTYNIGLTGMLQEARVAPYANGKNTIHISAQLANGELKEAFSTVLKMS